MVMRPSPGSFTRRVQGRFPRKNVNQLISDGRVNGHEPGRVEGKHSMLREQLLGSP